MFKIRMLQLPTRRSGPPGGVLALALGASSLAGLAIAAPQAGAGSTGATQTYVVLYKSGASTSGASSAVSSAGGTVVAQLQADRRRHRPVGQPLPSRPASRRRPASRVCRRRPGSAYR